MPQAIDLPIANAAAVSKTFSLVNPSGPDGTVATWMFKDGAIRGAFPILTAMSRRNAQKDARKGVYTVKVPSSFTDAATSQTVIGSSCLVNISVTIPDDFPESKKDDVVAYTKNFVASALFQSMMRDGLSAT